MRVIVIVKFEKNKANNFVFCIIISKFSYWQKPRVVILKIDQSLKKDFYNTVLSCYFSINL